MPLMPEDVVRKTFRTKMRGYDPAEVDAFLEEVVLELRRMQGQIDNLQASVHAGKERAQPSRLAAEQAQLDHIREERAELVREITTLQQRYDRLRTSVKGVEDHTAS